MTDLKAERPLDFALQSLVFNVLGCDVKFFTLKDFQNKTDFWV